MNPCYFLTQQDWEDFFKKLKESSFLCLIFQKKTLFCFDGLTQDETFALLIRRLSSYRGRVEFFIYDGIFDFYELSKLASYGVVYVTKFDPMNLYVHLYPSMPVSI